MEDVERFITTIVELIDVNDEMIPPIPAPYAARATIADR